jgi:RNAse (barnase) inhibitor barstar
MARSTDPKLTALELPESPFLHRLIAEPAEAETRLRSLEREGFSSPSSSVAVRTIRGAKARTKAELLNEASAALQFPCTFGANWDAFHDCLSDLTWLPSPVVIVLVLDGHLLLDEDRPDELETFVRATVEAASWLSQPHRNRIPRALHLVVQADRRDADTVATRFLAANARLDDLR